MLMMNDGICAAVTIVSIDLVLSLVGEVGLVLCFALAFYLLAADGATNRRVILCAVWCIITIAIALILTMVLIMVHLELYRWYVA